MVNVGDQTDGYIIKANGNNYGLGKINKLTMPISSDLDVNPFPFSGSKATQVFDYSGVTRKFTILGTKEDTTIANLFNNFIVPMDELLTGAQEVVTLYLVLIDYATAYANSAYNNGKFLVKVSNFTPEWDAGNPLTCTYTLELVESV